ncbi:MAG TPA: hypothetical protein VFC39_20815 [Acidobacteriaceae bacterium]|nr:hypothetical protein [Acidobacteriaceae bacterium]
MADPSGSGDAVVARNSNRVFLPTANIYFHHPNRNRRALQLSLDQVIQGLAHNQVDPRRAGLLLFALQIAATRM